MTKIRNSITAVICLLMVFVASIASAQAEDRAKEMVAAVQEKMDSVKSYHANIVMDMVMTVHGQRIQTTMNGGMDIFVKPILAKTNMDIVAKVGGKEIHSTMLQYMEQLDSTILSYTYIDGKWQKISMPIGTFTPAQDYENYLKSIKSAHIISETQDTAVIEAVIDGKYLKEILDKNSANLGVKGLNLTDEMLNSLGDISYKIAIDKNANRLSSIDMDLSQLMRRFGEAMAESSAMPIDKKGQVREIFSNIEVQMHMSMDRFDEIETFTIPDEAKVD